jgi:hypothetical protein
LLVLAGQVRNRVAEEVDEAEASIHGGRGEGAEGSHRRSRHLPGLAVG